MGNPSSLVPDNSSYLDARSSSLSSRETPVGAPTGPRVLFAVAVSPTVSPWNPSKTKRAVDLVLTIVALPVACVLTLLLSAVSAIRFRCNPFFVQQRRGIHEETFSVVKIRSLPLHFPTQHGKHEIGHHEFDRWSDFLRKTHLDELPQLLNIIAGSMSIVGPRPMIDEVIDTLEPADRRKRAEVKPGLTGPWQISTMGVEPLHDHPELDNQYVDKSSFISDMKIIALTVTTVLRRKDLEPGTLTTKLGW